jgi:hypothetical protein
MLPSFIPRKETILSLPALLIQIATTKRLRRERALSVLSPLAPSPPRTHRNEATINEEKDPKLVIQMLKQEVKVHPQAERGADITILTPALVLCECEWGPCLCMCVFMYEEGDPKLVIQMLKQEGKVHNNTTLFLLISVSLYTVLLKQARSEYHYTKDVPTAA